MATLYEIDTALEACLDAETGEIIDPVLLDELMMERDRKIENVALWVKNLESDVAAIKAEEEALAQRRKSAEKRVEGLKNWLGFALQNQKFSTAKCAISFRRSQKVEVLDLNKVPEEFLRTKTTVDADKKAIGDLLKKGIEIDGCALLENHSIKIV